MRCANCGGVIHLGKSCENCGISYDDMLETIHHDEMLKLFKKLKKLIDKHRDISLEASLLACELHNSSLIVPAIEVDGHLRYFPLLSEKDEVFLPVFTDMETFSHFPEKVIPMTNSFDMVLDLYFEGIVINPNEEYNCTLEMEYIDKFFRDG